MEKGSVIRTDSDFVMVTEKAIDLDLNWATTKEIKRDLLKVKNCLPH